MHSPFNRWNFAYAVWGVVVVTFFAALVTGLI